MTIDFRVYLITDRRQAPGGDILRAVAGALDGGVRAVQLREKDLDDRDLLALALRMRALTSRFGARLLINGRADVAKAAGADGVHLGSAAPSPREARALLGSEALIGCSAHTAGELARAEEGGADFATFGPVYDTPSKRVYGPPVGAAALASACAGSAVPVFALGGVTENGLEEIFAAGAHGVALISGIVAAADPRAAAARIVAQTAALAARRNVRPARRVEAGSDAGAERNRKEGAR